VASCSEGGGWPFKAALNGSLEAFETLMVVVIKLVTYALNSHSFSLLNSSFRRPPFCPVPYPCDAPLLWTQAFDTRAELELVPFCRTLCHLAEAVYSILDSIGLNWVPRTNLNCVKILGTDGEERTLGILLHERKSSKADMQVGVSSGIGCKWPSRSFQLELLYRFELVAICNVRVPHDTVDTVE
jgi:hypothetical protein